MLLLSRLRQYRVINTSNPAFLRDIASAEGGIDLMVALGFREDAEGRLILPMVGIILHIIGTQGIILYILR